MTLQTKQIEKGICRNKHSVIQNHHGDLKYCDNCKAMVPIINKNTCSCCLFEIKRKKNTRYNQVKKIMNKVVSKYAVILDYYEKNIMPNNIPLLAQVEHQILMYEVDLKFAIIYLNSQEMNEEDRLKTYELIRKNIKEVKFIVSWGRSKTFKLFID